MAPGARPDTMGQTRIVSFHIDYFLDIDQRFGIHMIYRFIPICMPKNPWPKNNFSL